jgi:RNA polymerase sigma-70 factor (ECF subfamily)
LRTGGGREYDRPALTRLPRYDFDRPYVERLIAEDEDTERHFLTYFDDLLSLKLRSRLRSPSLVEDAKQETFVRVIRTLKQKGGLDSPESLGAFVNGVCNNVLFELYRAEAKAAPLEEGHEVSDEGLANAEVMVMANEEQERVRDALSALPEKEKDLLRWLFFEDRDKDEVCRELNVDRNYLRVLLHRAKNHFRDRYNEQGGR